MPIKNPLRYPGGKSKLYNYIHHLLVSENQVGCTFYEPFAGSAAISLLLLENNVIRKAVINELDPLIYNFWVSVFHHTDELVKLIDQTEITIENWHEFSRYRNPDYLQDKSSVEIGLAGLFLNRTNFSGILKANPLGGLEQRSQYKIDCRFNKEKIIASISALSAFRDRIEIHNMDAIDFMRTQVHTRYSKDVFVYIDPPYFKEGPSLYRCFYTQPQHTALANFILTKAYPWLISYDDVDEIRTLYSRVAPVSIYMDYSAYSSKKGKELLISNLEIPPMEASLSKTTDAVS